MKPLDPTPSLLQKTPTPSGSLPFSGDRSAPTHSMFSFLAPATAASKNADGDEGRRSGPASPGRLRHMHADVAELLEANTTPRRRRAKKPVQTTPE